MLKPTTKRNLRLLWVLAANGFLVYAILGDDARGFFFGGRWRDLRIWFDMIFGVCVPLAGIFLEMTRKRSARWVNIAAFGILGCFWLAVAIWWHDDPFFKVFLIISAIMFALAGVTAIVYRTTKTDSPRPSNSGDRMV